MSPAARLIAGITLITVPTIVYGGVTLLGIVSSGRFGLGIGRPLTPEQTTFFRAGHAHAGVLVIFSLVTQVLLDHANLSPELTWALRIGAPLAAICVSGGFFGVAFFPSFKLLLYTGAVLVSMVTLATGIGLLR
ncbi:MAG TPA: hypothetical protein VFN45_12575 [Myxococcaceae bacterium]|nr:hypothetical protein [Myxococcaceae bacterium]